MFEMQASKRDPEGLVLSAGSQLAVIDAHCIAQSKHIIRFQSPAKIQNVTEFRRRHICFAGYGCLTETTIMDDVLENESYVCHVFTSVHSKFEYN